MHTCPKCSLPLTAIQREAVRVDVCAACGGGFLGAAAFSILAGEAIAPARWQERGLLVASEPSPLKCPAHGEAEVSALRAHSLRYRDLAVEVDLCPTCGGVWLDAHEGHALRRIARGLAFDEAERQPHPPAPLAPLRRHWTEVLDDLFGED